MTPTDAPPPIPPPAGASALAAAVVEVEQFAGTAGWDTRRQLFALVSTAELLAAEPQLAASIDATVALTPVAQDDPAGDNLTDALAGIAWPAEVVGCVLVQEIVAADSEHPLGAAAEVRSQGRLAAGVLRDAPGGYCVLRWRAAPNDPVRAPDLAPGLLAALHATFED